VKSLKASLGVEIRIGSGAIGTVLRHSLYNSTDAVEFLNLSRPELVTALHLKYRDAGSKIFVTNTFAANSVSLQERYEEALCFDINSKGVELAREVAGDDVLVWGSVGALALGLGIDDYSPQQLTDIYSEQCRGLCGADALVLETFTSLLEAEAALKAAKATSLPIILQFGNTGEMPAAQGRIDGFLKLAEKYDVAAIGVNCQHPAQIVNSVRYLSKRTLLPITAAANAGHPTIDRGIVHYEFPPEAMLAIAEELCRLGVNVIGGCCGTIPAHIRALAAKLSGLPVAEREQGLAIDVSGRAPEELEPSRPNRIRELIESDRLIVSVEIRADRRTSLANIVESSRQLADAGADMFDVPDNPGAAVGRDAMVVAAKLQDLTGTPSIPHKTVTQSNLLQLHSSLIGCWDLGLEGVLAITGDAPSMGHMGAMASRVKDVRSSVELLRLVRKMGEGRMITDEPISDPPDLYPGCAVSSVASTGQINWLKKKIDAGARFYFSQPFFDIDDFERLHAATVGLPARFLPGIMPLASKANAEYLAAGRIPGIRVSSAMVDNMGRYEDVSDQRRYGLEHALKLAEKIALVTNGIYLIMPFGKACYDDAASIVGAIKDS
jgi:methionine synthase I (cobalamin-dependent)/5,10-methylenetetrahydrofolate reductase